MFQHNISLHSYNTFGMKVKANHFARFSSTDQLTSLLKELPDKNLLLLGGGSNILFTQDFKGTVLKNEIKGIECYEEDASHYYVKVGGGEAWHDFVLECIKNNWAGVENMSLIPGTVGAAPIQNIGAYGVELKDVFYKLDALNIETLETETFTAEDCHFGYRNSVFKQDLKGKYIIVNVYFRLNKTPEFKTTYGDIQSTLEKNGVTELSIKAVSDAVIEIRQSKLPDPAQIGNSGSFFKNPEIPTTLFNEVKTKYPDLVGYTISETQTKVPAGWLIDKAGWKGFTRGNIGVHKKQALVLVNYGDGNGKDIYQLALDVKQSVKEKYNITIEPEVNII